jgi:alcohol dehydrogenase class IV
MFKAPHGMICACMLPVVFAANVYVIKKRFTDSSVLSRFTEVSKILCNNDQATVYDGTKWLEDIVQALNVPKLAVYGITKEDIPIIVEKAQNASSMKANPVKFSDQELSEILEKTI